MDLRSVKSYLYPVLIKKYTSTFNGYLELSMQNGVLVVDSPNANYSYGNLHKVFDKAISQLKLDKDKKYNCLILGFGAGSIAQLLLQKYQLNTQITGIEIDPLMIEIYHENFDLHADELTILNENAFDFIEYCTVKYDVILIDLFIDLDLPSAAKDVYFFQQLNHIMHSKTKLCMNVIGKDKQLLFERWQKSFNRNNYRKDYFDLNTVFFSLPK